MKWPKRGENRTYLRRPPHFQKLSVSSLQHRFSSHHLRAITQHDHTDERKAIFVPSEHFFLVFFCFGTTRGRGRGRGSRCITIRSHRNVAMSSVVFENRNEIHTSDLRNRREDLRTVPGVVDERGQPVKWMRNGLNQYTNSRKKKNSPRPSSTDLIRCKNRRNMILVEDWLTENLRSHLFDSRLGEERERVRDCVW